MARHAWAAAAGVISLAVFVWMITCGTGRLTDAEVFGQFYDAQARSLVAGRWDVPPEAIGEEAFIRDGKTYGYFGFVPALIRVPLNAVAPAMEGRWSRLSMTAACAVSLLYAYLLLLEVGRCFPLRHPAHSEGPLVRRAPGDRRPGDAARRGTNSDPDAIDDQRPSPDGRDVLRCAQDDEGVGPLRVRGTYAAFLLTAGLGSTLIFLASRAFIFHEAIIWGAAFALASYNHLLRHLRRPSWRPLAAACGFSFLAFFSRASVGGGAVLAVLLVAVAHAASRRRDPCEYAPRNGRYAVVALASVLATVVVFVAVNRAKFGTWFEAVPLRFYYPMVHDPARLARIGGRHMSVANVSSAFTAYTSTENLRVSSNFPWVDLAIEAAVLPEAGIDIVEPFTSFTAATPALTVLALLGLTALRRRIGPGGRAYVVLLGAAAGGASVLTANAISQRYLHDFFPLLVLSGAFGLHAVMAFRTPVLRRAALALGGLMVLFGVYANCGVALVSQRVYVWGVPRETKLQFQGWQRSVDQ